MRHFNSSLSQFRPDHILVIHVWQIRVIHNTLQKMYNVLPY